MLKTKRKELLTKIGVAPIEDVEELRASFFRHLQKEGKGKSVVTAVSIFEAGAIAALLLTGKRTKDKVVSSAGTVSTEETIEEEEV